MGAFGSRGLRSRDITEPSLVELTASLKEMGLVADGERLTFERLAGGVSSDIWLVGTGEKRFCVKRALSHLRVEEEWKAPLERNLNEAAWFETVWDLLPGVAPKVLGVDIARRLFAMEWLDPKTHPVWKELLRHGQANPEDAFAVGRLVGRIHAATSGQKELAAKFDSKSTFEALRIEPYLRATAMRYSNLRPQLEALADRTMASENARALVHGDVSPKNILIGPQGPIFLDAECAWYGDPAFDSAFCLTHLLLKCLWVAPSAPALLASFERFWTGYENEVNWEPTSSISNRVATLIPALLLARIDGKSPVEYLVNPHDKDFVRQVACVLIESPVNRVIDVKERWAERLPCVLTGGNRRIATSNK